MPKAVRLPSGSWRCIVCDGTDEAGKRIRKSFTAPTKAAAELEAAQYLAKKKHESRTENLTVGEAISKYIELKSAILSPSTLRGYKSIRENSIPDLMRTSISRLNNVTVQNAFNIESAKGSSPKTLRNICALLTASLSLYAPDVHLQIDLPQKKKPDLRIPTKDELDSILKECSGTPLELAVVLAATMGLRRSEIAGLRWSDIDEKHHTLTVRRAEVYGGADIGFQEKDPKTTESLRTLTVHDLAWSVLEKNRPPKADKNSKVWPYRPNAMYRELQTIQEKIGIAPFRFHDLRHYYASVLLSLGLPNKYAARRMGHATENMLQNVYQHIMAETVTRQDEQINTFFSQSF